MFTTVIWETGQVHTGHWWQDLRERAHLEDRRVDGAMILQWIFKKWGEEAWIGLIWIKIGKGVGASS
jgi:hypothetical protein